MSELDKIMNEYDMLIHAYLYSGNFGFSVTKHKNDTIPV